MTPAVLFAAALLAAAPAQRSANEAVRDCILVSDSSSTSYHPIDDHTIIIESAGRWYRLTTTPSALMLQPWSHFVNEIHGPSTLCSPLDFQLSVVEQPGDVREGLIVQDFRRITPEEGRALRPRFKR